MAANTSGSEMPQPVRTRSARVFEKPVIDPYAGFYLQGRWWSGWGTGRGCQGSDESHAAPLISAMAAATLTSIFGPMGTRDFAQRCTKGDFAVGSGTRLWTRGLPKNDAERRIAQIASSSRCTSAGGVQPSSSGATSAGSAPSAAGQ